MKNLLSFFAVVFFATQSSYAQAQFNPQPGWKDSYAVGGKCYCDSNGYDHNLDQKTALTPVGRKNVVEICNAITAALGRGPTAGRIPYNDIQCGNGPANDAPDEAGCPGRVDIGPAGCNQIGPTWDLISVYGSGANTALPRTGWSFTASSNAGAVAAVSDGNANSRWATEQTQRDGQFFQVDMGSVKAFNRIVLDSTKNPNDYPRSYQVWLSNDGQNWRGPIVDKLGDRAITDINFADQSARFVRIEQNGVSAQNWWSIDEINLYQSAPVTGGVNLDPAGWQFSASSDSGNARSAVDGNTASRWATRTVQRPGQFFQIDMQQRQRFNQITLKTDGNPFDYPRGYVVRISDDGANWSGPIANGAGNSATTVISFAPLDARFIRIEQTGSDNARWWSIHELLIKKAN
jgi:hypothetical protein